MWGGGLESNSSLPGMEAEATKYLKLGTGLLCSSTENGWGGWEGCLSLLSGIPKAVHVLRTDALKALGVSWGSSYRAGFLSLADILYLYLISMAS